MLTLGWLVYLLSWFLLHPLVLVKVLLRERRCRDMFTDMYNWYFSQITQEARTCWTYLCACSAQGTSVLVHTEEQRGQWSSVFSFWWLVKTWPGEDTSRMAFRSEHPWCDLLQLRFMTTDKRAKRGHLQDQHVPTLSVWDDQDSYNPYGFLLPWDILWSSQLSLTFGSGLRSVRTDWVKMKIPLFSFCSCPMGRSLTTYSKTLQSREIILLRRSSPSFFWLRSPKQTLLHWAMSLALVL